MITPAIASLYPSVIYSKIGYDLEDGLVTEEGDCIKESPIAFVISNTDFLNDISEG